jgi:hypothetical protein
MKEGTFKVECYLSDVLWVVQVHELDEVVQSPHSVVLLNRSKIFERGAIRESTGSVNKN